MSGWDPHLQRLLSSAKCQAGLYGMDGTQWAGVHSLPLPSEEVKYIIGGFASSATLFASGPKVNGVKYFATRADGELIVLKHGTDGLVASKSKQAITFCKFSEEDITPAMAVIRTTSFADYLKSIGY